MLSRGGAAPSGRGVRERALGVRVELVPLGGILGRRRLRAFLRRDEPQIDQARKAETRAGSCAGERQGAPAHPTDARRAGTRASASSLSSSRTPPPPPSPPPSPPPPTPRPLSGGLRARWAALRAQSPRRHAHTHCRRWPRRAAKYGHSSRSAPSAPSVPSAWQSYSLQPEPLFRLAQPSSRFERLDSRHDWRCMEGRGVAAAHRNYDCFVCVLVIKKSVHVPQVPKFLWVVPEHTGRCPSTHPVQKCEGRRQTRDLDYTAAQL